MNTTRKVYAAPVAVLTLFVPNQTLATNGGFRITEGMFSWDSTSDENADFLTPASYTGGGLLDTNTFK